MWIVSLVLLTAFGSGLRSQAALRVENAALRHQLAVLQRQARGRPRLRPVDRLVWMWLCHLWPGSRSALVIVKPDTVLRWHRQGFRFGSTGAGRVGRVDPVGPESRAPFKRSFVRWAAQEDRGSAGDDA